MNCKECGRPLPEKGDVEFEAFWACYPVKKDKIAAQRAWKRLNRDDKTAAVGGLDYFRRYAAPMYLPYPATYLNHRRWEDVVIKYAPDPNSGGLARRDVKEVLGAQRGNLVLEGISSRDDHRRDDSALRHNEHNNGNEMTREQRAVNIAKLGSILDGLGKIL